MLYTKDFHRHFYQRGQILLLVVLIMVVVLTVGLSLAARSIIQVRNSQDSSDSQKAFSAAEAGVEAVLRAPTPITIAQPLGNNASINQVNIQSVQSNAVPLNNANPILQDDGADIWLSDYSTNQSQLYSNPWTGTMQIYWGSTSACTDAALEVIVLSGTKANPTITRYGFDACTNRRTSSNHFSAPIAGTGSPTGCTGYNFSTKVTVASGLIAKVIPLYSDTPICVAGFTDVAESSPQILKPQGQVITSTGVSGSTQRSVTYYQGFESVPSELFYTLFSP